MERSSQCIHGRDDPGAPPRTLVQRSGQQSTGGFAASARAGLCSPAGTTNPDGMGPRVAQPGRSQPGERQPGEHQRFRLASTRCATAPGAVDRALLPRGCNTSRFASGLA